VFDVADLIKDALILPQAFIAAMAGEEEQAFRQRIISSFNQHGALDLMIETLQSVAADLSEVGR
jgi:CRISPR-associated protein Cas1